MKKKERVPDAIYERGYVYNFHFHLIWVTKYRCPAFTTPELVQDMKDILNKVAELNGITIETMEVMPDHVHLLISFKPKYAPTNIVKAFKGGSARLFFSQHPEIKKKKNWEDYTKLIALGITIIFVFMLSGSMVKDLIRRRKNEKEKEKAD